MRFDTKSLYLPQVTANGAYHKDMEFDGSLPENLPDIARLIRVEAKTNNVEIVFENGKAVVKCRVDFGILYESDYKGKLAFTHSETEFTLKTDIPEPSSENYSMADVSAEYLTCKLLGPRRYVIRAKMAAKADVIEIQNVTAVNTESTFLNAFFATDSMTFMSPCGMFEDSRTAEARADAASPIENIVCVNAEADTGEASITEGRLSVKCNIAFKAICEGEDGGYFTVNTSAPVTLTAEDSDISEDRAFKISIKATMAEAKTETDDYGESRIVSFACNVNMKAVCHEEITEAIANDAFCGDRSCECTKETVKCHSYTGVIEKAVTFEKSYDTEKTDIHSILDTSLDFAVTDIQTENGSIKIKYRLSAEFLANTDSGIIGEGFDMESEEVLTTAFKNPVVTNAYLKPDEVNASVAGNENIVLRGKATLYCCTFETVEKNLLTSVNAADTPEKLPEGIKLYYPQKSENAWDISKKYRKNPKILVSDNPNSFETDGKLKDNAVFLIIKE